ncbi:MAG TPA: hypothetical protein PKA29_02850 [Candidatus Saccharibacteria bacterium]|jgi:hypothetical protein|nr:hypothetical protein [Candidatus Saccharibacteria bacterium]
MTKSPESRASRTFKSISMWGILGFICSGILVYNQDGLSSWFTENEISHLGRMPVVDDEGTPLVIRAYLPNWGKGETLRLSAAALIDMASVASRSSVSMYESPVSGEEMPVLHLGTSYNDVGGQPIDAIESSSTCQPLAEDCLPKSVSIPPSDVDAIVARCFAINPDARSTLNKTTLNNFRTYFGVDLSFKLNSTPTKAISRLKGMECHASLGGR